MKKVRVITAEEAALMVKDGDTVSTGGFVSCACPEALTKALENRFVETGHPRDLTLFFAAGQGHRDGTGGDHFGHEGMCKRVVGGHWDRAAKLGELALANKLEAYNLPQGVITHMYRDIAAHNIGTITHVGLNTFVDPRHEGGKLNECTKEDLVKLVNIDGEERLLYKPIPINVCPVPGHQELRRYRHRPGGKDRPGRHPGPPSGEDPRHLCGCHRGGFSRGKQPVPGHAL